MAELEGMKQRYRAIEILLCRLGARRHKVYRPQSVEIALLMLMRRATGRHQYKSDSCHEFYSAHMASRVANVACAFKVLRDKLRFASCHEMKNASAGRL